MDSKVVEKWLNKLIFDRPENKTEVFVNSLSINPHTIGVVGTKYLAKIIGKRVPNQVICLDEIDLLDGTKNPILMDTDAISLLLIE